ncbi:MAG: PAS domain S-box protein [Telluria sp.]
MPSRRRWLPTTLKGRVTAMVTLLVLGATALVTLFSLLLAERDMVTVIGNQQYAAVSSVAATIDDRLNVKRAMLASLGDGLPETVLRNPTQLGEWVRAHPAALTEFFNISIVLPNGEFGGSVLGTGHVSAVGKPYFEDTVRSGQDVISAPFKSGLSGQPVVLMTHPLYGPDGKLRVVLIGGIDLQSAPFVRQIDSLRPGRTGFFFIMTTSGILVDHPDKARLLEHINARPGYNEATERALKGFEGWTEAKNKQGEDGIYAYRRLHNTNWIVAARFPTAEAFAPMISMQRKGALAAAVFAVLAGLLGWHATRTLLTPLQRLADRVSSVRARRADLSVLRSNRNDEIGALARVFYELTADRQAAQEKTRESEVLVRTILDRAPDAFIATDAGGVITEWNRRAEEILGWSRAEAIGRDMAALLIPPHMHEAHRAGMERFALTGSGPVVDNRVRVTAVHRDGREIPVEISVGAVPHGGAYYATAFLHDISDRLQYEEQIKSSERRARIIADTIPVLISYVDTQERYQFTNAFYQELLGVDPRSMIGRTVLEVRGEESYRALKPHIDAALRGERVHFEHEGWENGRHIHFVIDYLPDLGSDGRIAGFYAMANDISERKSSELRQAASEKRLKLITDHLPVLISYVDREERFQFANAIFKKWYGVTPDELPGTHVSELVSPRTYERAHRELMRAFRGEAVTFEFESDRGGVRRVLRLSFVPDVQADGQVAGAYALAHDVTDMKVAQEQLIQLARVDSLTGIANRRMFVETLAQSVERARRHHTMMALAYLDVDHFKRINDTYGHATGDEVLKEFARRMVAIVRASDTVARLSGDEFVIILGDLRDPPEMSVIAAKIIDAMRAPFNLPGATLHVTASIGIARFEGGAQAQEQLLANADAALYEAKRNGRNGYAVFGDQCP